MDVQTDWRTYWLTASVRPSLQSCNIGLTEPERPHGVILQVPSKGAAPEEALVVEGGDVLVILHYHKVPSL